MALQRPSVDEFSLENDDRRDTTRWHTVMCVGVRVFSVVVFLDLIECIAVYRDFTVIMIPTPSINISDIRCFYKLEPRSFAVMRVRVVVFLEFFRKCIPCFGRREFDIIMVMVTVIDSTIAGACHLFLQGRVAAPLPLFYCFIFPDAPAPHSQVR